MNHNSLLSVPPTSANQTAGPETTMQRCIHQLFEARVAANPKSIALTFGDTQVTYNELNERANQVAHRLQRLGVKSETLVGICLDRSVEMFVGILGILKAGGAYVPIEPMNPTDRIAFILQDAQTPVLLTESKFASKFAEFPTCLIALDSERETLAKERKDNPACPSTPDSLSYVIYTSGSTGKPKGVLVTHSNVVRLMESTDHWYGFNESDVWTLFHSFAFDFSVWEIWGALVYGGRVVVVPYYVTREPQAFYDLLAKEKVTVLNQTPSAFRQLIWAEDNSPEKKQLALRYVIFGGEALELQSLRPWFSRHGDQKPHLVNMYGITETTVHVTYRVITQKDVEAGCGSVIGVPIPDLQLYVLDEQLKQVPVGEAGEMFVGGAGVARGYLNRADLTAQKFIANPFGPGKLYRSGDLARVLPGGDLEYLGRIDLQVKIRGHRIELGEIEATLNKHTGIRESTVIAHESAGSDKRLVAYVVSKEAPVSTTELREFAAKTLPTYMIPSLFMFVDSLPLTINGKVDRRALPSPDRARPEMRTSFVPPTSQDEKLLAKLWSEALQVDQIGVHDNFFELGGDSIRSIQVLAKAQQLGLKLSLQQLFQTPTIFELARSKKENEDAMTTVAPFSLISETDRKKLPAGLEDAYPAAALQAGMIFHSNYDPKSAIFHDVFSFRINAPFDLPNLKKAIGLLTARHSIYRTSVDLTNFAEPLQFVHKDVQTPLSVEDLRHLDAEAQKRALVEWVDVEKRNRFEWSVPPMMRLHLQRYSENEFQFIVSFHHVIMDGWSLAAMLTEVFQDYFALLKGEDSKITSPKVSYRDFVALEKKTIESDVSQNFWKSKLESPTVHTLPRWPKTLCKGGREQVRGPEIYFDKPLFEKLKKVANSAGVPIRTVLLTAHLRALSSITGQTDMITGLVTNGRPQAIDGDRLIGLFLNTLPLRVDCGSGTWNDLIRSTFEAERDLLPHRRTPLSQVQNLTGGRALFETTFDFVQFHVYRDLPGYGDHTFLEDYYFEANNFPFFVTFMVDVTGTQLQMHYDYNPNEFCEEQIKNICDYYANALEAIAKDPEASHQTFSPLTAAEKEKLLEEWNQTGSDYDRSACVHTLFEQQVTKTPQNIAAVFGKKGLTYGQLNNSSNVVAAKLRQLGAGPGDRIGISVERSLEMLISVLGVLKAGSSYVPLDPHFPKDRLQFMAADAQIKVLLTDKHSRAELAPAGCTKLFVEELDLHRSAVVANPPATAKPYDIAYTIYTSGSTGKPKGVQVPHSAVVNFLCSMQREPGLTTKDTLLAVTTLSFDIAGLELFLPLTVGAKVVIAGSEAVADAFALDRLIFDSKATVMQATPATWRMLFENGWRGNLGLKVLCGGEALTQELATKLLECCDTVWNMYGPTETTIWSCVHRVTSGSGPIPIGHPIANTQVYLLNGKLQPVPLGSEGELYIGGEGLASGYWQRSDLTAQKFIPDPFSKVAGARLYHTGDLARYLPDGNIVCTGRVDHQVKIRGFRIELGEIESALRQQSMIVECVVDARENQSGEKNLVAYLVSEPGASVSVAELRNQLRQKLPDYMIPAAFVILDKLPLTPNGKVDRKALPQPDKTLHRETKYLAPETPIEKAIAEIWREVLNVEQVGLHDNFFELGGHSLLAMRVVARLRETLGIELTIASLFETPRLSDFALFMLNEVLRETEEAGEEMVNAE
jgi:amino acid adenylation domain-containing protein